MDIKHIITAIAVTSMGVAYCELPPVPDDMEVYDAERDGISYEEEYNAGRAPSPTDYKAADKVLLRMNNAEGRGAYLSNGDGSNTYLRDMDAQRRIRQVRELKKKIN